MNPGLENGLLLLSYQIFLSITNNSLEILDQVCKIYTLSLPDYFLWAPIAASPSSMRATVAIFDTDSEYNRIRDPALPLTWQRYVCPDYVVPLVEHVNGILQQIP